MDRSITVIFLFLDCELPPNPMCWSVTHCTWHPKSLLQQCHWFLLLDIIVDSMLRNPRNDPTRPRIMMWGNNTLTPFLAIFPVTPNNSPCWKILENYMCCDISFPVLRCMCVSIAQLLCESTWLWHGILCTESVRKWGNYFVELRAHSFSKTYLVPTCEFHIALCWLQYFRKTILRLKRQWWSTGRRMGMAAVLTYRQYY